MAKMLSGNERLGSGLSHKMIAEKTDEDSMQVEERAAAAITPERLRLGSTNQKVKSRAEAAEMEVLRLRQEVTWVEEQVAHDREKRKARWQKQERRQRDESTDQQEQTQKLQAKLDASEMRAYANLEMMDDIDERALAGAEDLRLVKSRLTETEKKLKDMLDTQEWMEQAYEEATNESADACNRLRELGLQLAASEAAARRDAEAREDVEEEMEFQSLVLVFCFSFFNPTLECTCKHSHTVLR
jgi:hypothetical protein